jgi:mannose/fructose/N-acetylgalactosamine-specific phosphotransferase system component IID
LFLFLYGCKMLRTLKKEYVDKEEMKKIMRVNMVGFIVSCVFAAIIVIGLVFSLL